MMLNMLAGILDLWFVFVALSLIFVAYDIRTTPVSWVQKLGWILVTMYTGPIGLFVYMLACRSPGKGLHDLYTQVHWKQAVNSEVHCVAGDATGIIFSAFVLTYFALPNGLELIIEYSTAFIFGWFIFQATMMKSMYHNYWEALRKTFFAETVSMNMVMVGMLPTMVIMMHFIPNANNPESLRFWFTMGMATIVGSLTAYPMNSWLVRRKLKHGCMTLPETPAEIMQAVQPTKTPVFQEHHEQEIGNISLGNQLTIICITFVILIAAILITLLFAPIYFTS